MFKAYGRDYEGQNRDGDNDSSNLHYPRVIKWLDTSLESPVQHVAFPHINQTVLSSQASVAPEFTRSNVMVAVACADSSIYLVSFDIEADERDGLDIKTTKLNSAESHQDMVLALAITWTTNDADTDQHKPRSRSRGRTDATDRPQNRYSFLIASSSSTGSGLLIVHRVSWSRHIGKQGHSPVIIARQFLRMPLLRSTLSFNPATYPSTKHTTLLITSPAHGIIKVLDVAQSGSASKRRRGSEMDADSEEPSSIPSASTCLTLHADYTSFTALPRRKEILDARWVMKGKAIVALLEDGDWGTWNIEDTGVSGNEGGQQIRRINAAQSKFAVCGNVCTALAKARATKPNSSGALAPMTPHTRKSQSAELFASSETRASAKKSTKSLGRISICTHQGAAAGPDDALLISFGGSNSLVPTLQPLQPSHKRNNSTDAGSATTRVQALPIVRLGGEDQVAISLLRASRQRSNAFLGTFSVEQDVIVLTNSRLVLHTKPEPKSVAKATTLNLPLRSANGNDSTFVSRITNNEMLDLDAMDKMLDSIDTTQAQQHSLNEARNDLPFQHGRQNQDVDLDMASPTMPKSAKSKLIINRDAENGSRNLFD